MKAIQTEKQQAEEDEKLEDERPQQGGAEEAIEDMNKVKAASQKTMAARKAKAEAAVECKVEKERKEREERNRLATLHRTRVREEYVIIVGGEKTRKRKPLSTKTEAIDVASAALLKHAQSIHDMCIIDCCIHMRGNIYCILVVY